MSFALPEYSKSQINRAGEIIAGASDFPPEELAWAIEVLANWRACHGYPINTFQATLRARLKNGFGNAIVAQRLKRAPSIILKLQRFPGMQLSRMQDIGGLRAILGKLTEVRKLEKTYRETPFEHELTNSKDYIAHPKPDGNRGVHLIYRYKNKRAPQYDGLSLELQLRTRRQHAWATAVETMGTFLGQALKAGQGEREWRDFFSSSSAAIAILEGSPPVPGFEKLSPSEVFSQVAETESRLHVLDRLQGFAIATDQITTERGQGAYHLIVLDSAKRAVTIRPYPVSELADASRAYAAVEERTRAGESIEAVLVSAGPVAALRNAYPNYFLDTHSFMAEMNTVISQAGAASKEGVGPDGRSPAPPAHKSTP